MLKQYCWCAFSIHYPQSFSDNSSFSTEYYLQEERFEQKIRDLTNKLIGIQTKIRSPDAAEMKFYIKILKAGQSVSLDHCILDNSFLSFLTQLISVFICCDVLLYYKTSSFILYIFRNELFSLYCSSITAEICFQLRYHQMRYLKARVQSSSILGWQCNLTLTYFQHYGPCMLNII